MATVCRLSVVKPNKTLTGKQRQLVQLIEYRTRYHLPMVQQDLAEQLGIRRDSVNKLLRRARDRMSACGVELQLPNRRGVSTASVSTLMDGALR
jgi:predicted DNA-binding protein (UPF0251 family)